MAGADVSSCPFFAVSPTSILLLSATSTARVWIKLINFSGKNLSEVARLWIFLMPFVTAAGACWAARRARRAWVLVVLLLLQFIQCLVSNVCLDVLYKAVA